MKFILFYFLLSSVHGKILFSDKDATIELKMDLLAELIEIMGPNGSVNFVNQNEKVILWTSEAAILEREGKFESTTLPSFTMPSPGNLIQLQKIIQEQTGQLIPTDQIGGILIADPLQGAIMYFKKGYLGKGEREEDGRVSPAVIIYHEFSHAKDSLISPQYFTEMAASFNKRYKNDAEQSAVQQQNDFVLTAKFYGYTPGDLRQSYGRNDLIMVNSPWQKP